MVIMAQIIVNFSGTCLFSHLWQKYVILTEICLFLAKYVILTEICLFLAKYVILKLPFLGKDDIFWAKMTYFGQRYVILTKICPFLAKFVILKFAKITFFGRR